MSRSLMDHANMKGSLEKISLLITLAEASSYAEAPLICDAVQAAKELIVECERLVEENRWIRELNEKLQKLTKDSS